MNPSQQIAALMNGVANQPPDIVVPCKKNKTHSIKLLVRWEDNLAPVPMTDFKIFRGKTQYTSDSVAKGKYAEKKLPPGTYRLFFTEIDESEIIKE
ncbi:MAG TPA: hypothetical protein VG675_05475 [Bryobacteraceae bacterium]|nr:hypothetical protein [Bryobacteraceae bacterium]